MRITDPIHLADENDIGKSSLFRSSLNDNLSDSVRDLRVAGPRKTLPL